MGLRPVPKSLPSKRALATHSGRAHGYRRLVKFYAVDHTCNACAKTYATRKRLIEHLRDATECLHTLQACFPPLSDEQVVAFDAIDHETTLALRAQGWGAAKALALACLRRGRKMPYTCTSNGASATQLQAPALSSYKVMPSPCTRHRSPKLYCLMMICRLSYINLKLA